MNIYFLVEGDTEEKVYKAWLKYLLPELTRIGLPHQVDHNNYYLFKGKLHFNTHAQFHKDYLRELFKINNLKHYKITNEVIKEEYLEQLIARVQNETEHLPTFQTFIQFCNMIKSKLSKQL
ncbi:hypothetical protein FJR06_08540 [Dolichospermum sp. UHCC 0352]|uniref:hypothetical protein n=1 Tax=Nostocales TaxID=1161 RepID=UPI00029B63D2|nr:MULTISPECIES: hypothetical protein [Nostocales]AFW95223.1 hypothetical protein ANA_C12501 [Anabaena sp. 90]MTJ21369.1 hypothetical protein [Dolichospermum sp. UHCC 0352]